MSHMAPIGRTLFRVSLLAGLLAGCGRAIDPAAVAGANASGASFDARAVDPAGDAACRELVARYKPLDWAHDAARKGALIDQMIATRSDLVVDVLIADFRSLSWSKARAHKLVVLDALAELVVEGVRPAAAGGSAMAAQGLMSALSRWHPSLGALGRMAHGLREELAGTPAADKPRVQDVLQHISIIAPNSSR